MQYRYQQSGVTLIELMLAMTIGLIMIGGAIALFIQSNRSFGENEKISRMQDDARFVLGELSHELANAGFWAELSDAGSVNPDTSLTIATDCGPGTTPWVYDATTQITALDNATAATATAQFSCIDGTVVQPGTDIIGIKRTAGNNSAAPLDAGAVYVKSNGIVGLLFKDPVAAPPAVAVPAPATDWLYVPSIWYVRTHANDADSADGIPTMCRKFLDTSGTPSMIEECMARGVEDLQIEFGVDTDGDGVVDQYLANPAAALMPRVIAVRLFLLSRSVDPQQGYTNGKTYQLGNRAAVT
ncbi:MAG: PilW family protein, partial [Gammaproteobacteria bacterium]|nr:PilW family protein [Gammaproteobacteria bacterium]